MKRAPRERLRASVPEGQDGCKVDGGSGMGVRGGFCKVQSQKVLAVTGL